MVLQIRTPHLNRGHDFFFDLPFFRAHCMCPLVELGKLNGSETDTQIWKSFRIFFICSTLTMPDHITYYSILKYIISGVKSPKYLHHNILHNTVKPRFTAPRFTANPDIPRPFPFPQIALNIHNVNQTKPRFTADPDLPRMFPCPQTPR